MMPSWRVCPPIPDLYAKPVLDLSILNQTEMCSVAPEDPGKATF